MGTAADGAQVDRLQDGLLAAVQQRETLRPASGDVGQHEAVKVAAFRAGATVRNEVGLQEARPGVVPVGERADGHVPFEQGPGLVVEMPWGWPGAGAPVAADPRSQD